jgi:aminodeoxyfutalosine deaminase
VGRRAAGGRGFVTYPKIELHVHLEGTVRPETLLEIARRNGYALPVDSVEGLQALYEYRDFEHFLEVFLLTAHALERAEDFQQIVVEYAAEAVRHGAVYLEAIFSLGLWRGLDSDVVFSGVCDGADEARERYGIEIRLTPDIARVYTLDEALHTVRYAAKYRDRGVVGVGLGGPEAGHPPEPYAPAFQLGLSEGLGSVPHAGEHAGPSSIRGALDALGASRIRHGIRAIEDPDLLQELADRRVVLDVCPISNVCTHAVPSLDEHPLADLVAAGAVCSISTDDPAMFGTDLSNDYAAACSFGLEPRSFFEAGLEGALCDEPTRGRLREVGEAFDWGAVPAGVEVP